MNPVFVLTIIMPMSLVFWLFTCALNIYKTDIEPVSPVRFLVAILVPVLVAQWGLRRKSLDVSGAIAGLVVGFLLTVSNLCFFSALLAFFLCGTKVTRFRTDVKRSQEEDFKEGGMRNWLQVLCNGGVAAWLSFLYLLDVGSSEKLIDFKSHYNESWYCTAVLASLCCSCGDTFSSEIGSVVGKSRAATLITTLKPVPRGTNGGVSVVGILASVVGGALVGMAYYVTLVLTTNEDYLTAGPSQWPLIPVGGLLGLLGSTIDSVLGATLQYSGYHKKKQCVVHYQGPDIEDISGTDFLDNHSVNLLSSLLAAVLGPKIAFRCWDSFLFAL